MLHAPPEVSGYAPDEQPLPPLQYDESGAQTLSSAVVLITQHVEHSEFDAHSAKQSGVPLTVTHIVPLTHADEHPPEDDEPDWAQSPRLEQLRPGSQSFSNLLGREQRSPSLLDGPQTPSTQA